MEVSYDSIYTTFGKRQTIGAGTRSPWATGEGKDNVFQDLLLALLYQSPSSYTPAFAFNHGFKCQLKLEFLIQKYKHEVSLILIMEVARQQAFLLAL